MKYAIVGAVSIAALATTGCGGSTSSTHYSKPALVACLRQHGVVTRDVISHPATRFDRKVARLLAPIDPNFIGAKFPSGEFVGIAFAADSSGAGRVLKEFQKLAKSPGAGPGKIAQKGSIVVLTRPHVTAGLQNTLDKCESSAVTQ